MEILDLGEWASGLEEKIDYLRDIRVGIPLEQLIRYERGLAEIKLLFGQEGQLNVLNDAEKLSMEFESFVNEIFSSLTPLQIEAITRSMQRPKMLDYVSSCFEDFKEIGGNQDMSIDPAIVCGTAKLDGNLVMLIGHEKGRFSEYRNGGSAKPHGNRKAIKYMKVAEELNIPVITFIDTPGSYPLEEYLPAQSIAANIAEQGMLTVPHLSFIIGEGGSGGALAIDVSDRRIMAEKAYYSVISTQGAEAIVSKGKGVTQDDLNNLAKNLRMGSRDMLELGIVDCIVEEPFIGARISDSGYFQSVRRHLSENLDEICLSVSTKSRMARRGEGYRWKLNGIQRKRLVGKRYWMYMNIGTYDVSRKFGISRITRANDKRARLAGLLGELWLVVQEKGTTYYNRMRRRLNPAIRSVKEAYAPLNRYFQLPEEQERNLEKAIDYGNNYISCPNSNVSGKHDISAKRLFGWYDGVCPTCSYHFQIPIERYIEIIADRGSFKELDRHIRSANAIGFSGFDEILEADRKKTGRQCAMITGYATIKGTPVVMVLTDFAFRGGTLGSAEGEKYVRAAERALIKRLPVVSINQTGGVRIQEGITGLMQMVKTGLAAARLEKKGIPYISVHADPTMAGALASYVSLATVRIGEPNARIGFAGLNVIENTINKKLPPDYQHAEKVLERGGLDFVCKRSELRERIAEHINYYREYTGYEFN